MTSIIHIQKFSIHDGDGIRTTVFFKGCPLACAWCHNPESQAHQPELLFQVKKCTGCGACQSVCSTQCIGSDFAPDRVHCAACGSCVKVCPMGAREVAGKPYTVPNLVQELMKDEVFYEESDGGVTLSGGEVLAQDRGYLLELLQQLKQRGIHVAIDTCGYVSYERLAEVLPYTDLFLFDLKCTDSVRHEQYTGKPNELILENLSRLAKTQAKIYVRIPLIEGVNTHKIEIAGMLKFLKEVRPIQVNLLPYHSMGQDKNNRLQRCYQSFSAPSEERLQEIQARLTEAGIPIKIGG